MPPTPRPRDAAATRQTILDHARVQFARSGLRATVKDIADAAGVSPNLVTRYFGGKDGLFLAASAPQIAVDDVYTGDLAGLGERLAASIVRRWTGQVGDDPLLLLLRVSGERADAAEVLSGFLDRYSVDPLQRYLVAQGLTDEDAAARAAAVDAVVLGVSTRRRVLRDDLGPPDELQDWLAAMIRRLTTGS